jgi:hypothetical protein
VHRETEPASLTFSEAASWPPAVPTLGACAAPPSDTILVSVFLRIPDEKTV